MARISVPAEEDLSEAQKEVRDEAVAGIRGRMPAPMIAWIRNPELARRAQHLGGLLRYQTTLEPALSELAILVVGRHWTSHLEWTAHKREGLKAGLDPQAIADIAARRTPQIPDERQKTTYDFTSALMASGRVSRTMYDHAVAVLGETGVVELVAIIGYYCLAGLTLNVFELGLPDNIAPELEDPEFPDEA